MGCRQKQKLPQTAVQNWFLPSVCGSETSEAQLGLLSHLPTDGLQSFVYSVVSQGLTCFSSAPSELPGAAVTLQTPGLNATR